MTKTSFWSRQYWRNSWSFLSDFQRERSLAEKFCLIVTTLLFQYVYVAIIVNILIAAMGQDAFHKWIFWSWISGKSVVDQFQTSLTHSIGLSIFFAVILAPLWEEFTFRYYWFNKKLRKRDKEEVFLEKDTLSKVGKMPIWDFVIISSIIFGVVHGSPLNILIQGVGGLFLAYVYLANNRSYWSGVILHAMYNGGLILFSFWAKNAISAVTVPFWIPFLS